LNIPFYSFNQDPKLIVYACRGGGAKIDTKGLSVQEMTSSKPRDPAPDSRPDAQANDRVRRFSAVQLLLAIVLWIVSTPFIDALQHGGLIGASLLTLLLFSAVLVVGANRRKLILATVLAFPAFVGKWVDHFWPDAMPTEISLGTGLLFVAFVVVTLFRFILTAPRVNREVLCGAVSTYLMLGVLWAFAYLLLAELLPASFAFNAGPASERVMNGFNALYFSFVTLSTVGFGDIIPVSRFARMLAIVEAATGIIYMTVVIARLVALYSSGGSHNRPDSRDRS
jgi:voltage-gated potassium channel